MKALSDELTELAVRAKKTEDVLDAAAARDRKWLRARLDTLKSAMDDQAARAGERMVSARTDIKTEWGVLRASPHSHLAVVRAED